MLDTTDDTKLLTNARHATTGFRFPWAFDYIQNQALPALHATKGSTPIVIWSAACSTGSEAYALAILARCYTDDHPDARIRVIGSDKNERLVELARSEHRMLIAPGTIDELHHIGSSLDTYTKPHPSFQPYPFMDSIHLEQRMVTPEIADLCSFQRIDFTQEYLRADIVLASMALMYVENPKLHTAAVSNLERAVNPGGFLVIIDPGNLQLTLAPVYPDNLPYYGTRAVYHKPSTSFT